MAEKDDAKTVTREVLVTGMYHQGRDHYRGAEIELTEDQAKRSDDLGHTAEVGHLEKVAAEQAKMRAEAEERRLEAERQADEDAQRREALARDQLDPDAKSEPNVASTDGPRVETRSGSRGRR
jgi:dTMP kinase